MKIKKYLIVFLLILISLGYLFYHKKVQDRLMVHSLLYDLGGTKINKIIIKKIETDEKFVVFKESGKWYLFPKLKIKEQVDLNSYKLNANQFFSEAFAKAISSTKIVRSINVDNPGEFGLQKGRIRISFFLDNGTSNEFLIGGNTPLGDNVYVKKIGENNSFICISSIFNVFNKSFEEIRSHEMTSFLRNDIESISVKSDKKYFLLVRTLTGWKIEKPINDEINEVEVNKFLSTLTTSSVKDFIVDNFSKNEKKKYLKKGVLLTIEVKLKDKIEELLFSNFEGKIIVINDDKKFIAEVKPEVFEKLYVDLRQVRKNKILDARNWDISKIEFESKAIKTIAEKKGDKWELIKELKLQKNKKAIVSLEGSVIKSYLNYLDSLKVDDFIFSGSNPNLVNFGLIDPLYVIRFYKKKTDNTFSLMRRIMIGESYSKKGNKYHYVKKHGIDHIYGLKEDFVDHIPKEFKTLNFSNNKIRKVVQLDKKGKIEKLKELVVEDDKSYFAEIVTSRGKIKVDLFAREAPFTVSNFLNLSRNGFYDSVKFHRVEPGFLVQTGDPTGTGKGGPGYVFDDEINSRKHSRGTLSMARTSKPNTNGSQFFICLSPQPHLDNNNTIFGKVVSGMDLVDRITEDDFMLTVRVFEVDN